MCGGGPPRHYIYMGEHMDKTIKIGERDIKLRANALLPIAFRAEFGEDIFKKQMQVFSVFGQGKNTAANINSEINVIDIMKMIYAMAKLADKNILPFEKWLEEIDEFPVFDVVNQAADMFMVNMTSTTKIKNANAAGK